MGTPSLRGLTSLLWGTVFTNNIFFDLGDENWSVSALPYYAAQSGSPASNTTVYADYDFTTGPNGEAMDEAPPSDGTRWGGTNSTGNLEVNGINGGDPMFVNAAAGYFRLTTNSPAFGAGFDMSAQFTTDFLGNTRTAPWDIGPFGVVGASSGGGSVDPFFTGDLSITGNVLIEVQ